MAKLETLTDDFTTPPLNPAKWTFTPSGVGTATAEVSGGVLTVTVPQAGGATTGTLTSVNTYECNDTAIVVKLATTGLGVQTSTMKLSAAGSSESATLFIRSDGFLAWDGRNTSNTALVSGSVMYNGTTHAWWRLRHTGTVMYWESSPNGVAWTIHAQTTYSHTVSKQVAFDVTSANGSGPFTTTLDNVNLPPLMAASLIDDFSGSALNTTKWTPTADPTGVITINVAGGTLNFDSKTSTSGTHTASIRSAEGLALNSSHFAVQLTLTTASTVPTTMLRLLSTSSAESYTMQKVSTGNIAIRATNTSGTNLGGVNVAYNSGTMAFWRIRHAGTIVYYETSSNGVSWQGQHSITSTPSGTLYYASVEYAWSGATTVTSTRVDNANNFPALSTIDAETFENPTIVLPPPNIDTGPGGITNPETLSAVGITETRDAYPDSTADPEVIDLPETSFWWEETATLDSTADPEALGGPAYTFDLPVTADSTTDPETFGDPGTSFVPAPTQPNSLVDVETLSPPAAGQVYPPISTLIDSFERLDPSKWTITSYDQYLTASVTGGQLVFTTITGGANTTHGATVATPEGQYYSFTGSQIMVQAQPINTHNTPVTVFQIYGYASGEAFYIQKQGTTTTFRGYNNAGAQIATVNATYDPNAMAWWRIRHTAGTLYWETAYNDVGPWQIRLQAAYAPVAGRYYVSIQTTWTGIPPAGHTGRFDNINNIPSYSVIDVETLSPPTATVVGPKVETLTDNFDAASIDTTKWTYTNTASSGAYISSGQLAVYTNAGIPAPFGMVVASTELYDVANSSIFVKVTPYLHSITGTFLAIRNPANPKEYVAIYRQSTTLYGKAYDANGTQMMNSTATYSATAHAWWRIRLDDIWLNLETSPNGVNWTIFGNNPWYPTSKAMRVQLEVTALSGTSVAATSNFDNLNIDPATRPVGITDPAALGDPAVSFVPDYILPVDPDSVTDPETLEDPEATLGELLPGIDANPIFERETLGDPATSFTGDPIGIPDSINEAELIPEPVATAAGTDLIGVTTDGIQDPEVFGPPTLALAAPVQPPSLTDAELLAGPSITTEASLIDVDGLNDPELFGLLTLSQNDTPVTVGELVDPETLDPPANDSEIFPISLNDAITDAEELGPPDLVNRKSDSNFSYGGGIYGDGIYSGYQAPPDSGQTANYTYGTGTYGYGIYYGIIVTDNPPGTEVLPIVPPADGPVAAQNLSMGPWSPGIEWRGAPNYQVPRTRLTRAEADERSIGIATGGPTTTRPAMGLPPATRKGFTLRLNEGSEARVDLAMQRGDAVVIDEMDTDIWWRRKDPHTGKLEMIGRFNCAHADLTASDSGVNLSAQFVDYSTILSDRMVLHYMSMGPDNIPYTQWKEGTKVTDILAWALPTNTGIDMSEVRGGRPYDLGTITEPMDLPPGTLISDFMENLKGKSRVSWEWWVETPEAVDQAPKLRFVVGERGADKGVTLFDVGSGPTPIASWSRTGSVDDYANTLYFTGGGTGTGDDAGGGVVVDNPTQVSQYGQHDAQDGNVSLGGDLEQIKKGAEQKLAKLADRTPTFTIGLAFGFWKGKSHIDVGDTVRLILRLGKDVTDVKYRVTEIAVEIDENNLEDVTLTLGRPRPSNDPRSKRSPLMRIIRTFRNYKEPGGKLRPKT